MIRTFRHRGLKRFLEGDPSKVRAEQARRIADVLGHLDRAVRPSDLDLPGYRLHSLKGIWRILFRFIDGDAFDVDLQDCH